MELQQKTGDDIDFVITGHTHLCRSLRMDTGAHYFNSGTWIRLLRFTEACLADGEQFKEKIWGALKSGRMDDLDNLMIDGDDASGPVSLRFDRTNTVHIYAVQGAVTGALYRVEDDGPGQVRLVLEPMTEIVEV